MKTAKTPAGQRIRAVIYVRISQDRTGAHLGVDRQREDCEALAERNGWDVVETYIDNDVSAYSGKKRPDYRRMLDDLEAGLATVVIAWHTDRLHRSPTELEEYIDVSERRGVATHTCQAGPIDLATPSGRMVARMLGAVARHESEHKAERVARARLQKARAGQWAGGIRPFGWGMPTGETRTKTGKDGEEHQVPVLDMDRLVPEEAEALRHGTNTVLAGGSIRGFTKWLRDKGYVTPRGNEWSHQEAREILLRPRNAGIAVYQGQEIGPGTWEAAVPVEKFRAVVAVLTDPARRTAPGNTVKWFGSMIYRCGVRGCDKTVRCTKSGGANLPTYRCPEQHGGSRNAAKTDEYVEDLIIERMSREDAADLLLPAPDDVNVPALLAEAAAIRGRLTDLSGMFGAGHIDGAQLADGSRVAKAQLEGVNKQLARAALRDPLVELVGVPDVRAKWRSMELEQRRGILRELLEVTLYPPRRGRMPDGGYYDYDAIETRWKR